MIATTDWGQILAAVALVVIAVLVYRAVRKIDIDGFTRPEPETHRPRPEQPVSFAGALRPIGGLPRWGDTRLPEHKKGAAVLTHPAPRTTGDNPDVSSN